MNSIEKTPAKFEVGMIYVIMDVCYKVTNRTEKSVKFEYVSGCYEWETSKTTPVRRNIKHDDDGNEYVTFDWTYCWLSAKSDLHTYERLFHKVSKP